MLGSPDAADRASADREIRALGTAAIPQLLDAAAGPNLLTAEPARELLTALGPSAIEALNRAGMVGYYDHRQRYEEALDAVARMGPEVLPRMVEIFTTSHTGGSLFGFSVGVMARLRAVETLIPFLKHPKPRLREQAAGLLANLADPRAHDACVEGLSSEDATVRMMCARLLGNIRAHDAADALLARLSDDAFTVREEAASALGAIYERRFLPPLARLARSDGHRTVRNTAANILIRYSEEPIAIRVGKRYKPWGISPAQQPAILFGFGVRMALTSAFLIAFAVWLMRLPGRPAGDARRVLGTMVFIALGLGFLWGFVVDNIWGTLENILLFGVMPATAAFGYALIVVAGDSARRWLLHRWSVIVGGFYASYAIGWLGLWGYLGF
jgi:hypothetical protein